MAKRNRRISQPLAVIAVAFAALALAQLWLAAPLRLAGFALDADLAIVPGSPLPSPDVLPGDRVVAVNRQRIATRRELAAVLSRAVRGEATVVIEQRGRLRTATLSQLRFERDPPPDLVDAYSVVRVDERRFAGRVPVSEIGAFLAEAAPTPIEVEYELRRTQIEGPAAIRSSAPSALVLAWLALGALGFFGVALLASQGLSRRRDLPHAAATVALGALACSALTATALGASAAPTFALWAVAVFVVWRAVAAARGPASERGAWVSLAGPLAAVAVIGVAYVAVTAVGQDTVAGLLRQVAQGFAAAAAVGAGLVVGDLAGKGGSATSRRLRAIAVGVGVLAGAAVAVAAPDLRLEWMSFALLAAGAVLWADDVAAAVGLAVDPRRHVEGGGGESGLLAALQHLQDVAPAGTTARAYAGADRDFVAVSSGSGAGGEARLVAAPASEEVAALMAMLATEGGMLPRGPRLHGHDVIEEDPFEDVQARLGVVAAVPLRAAGAAGLSGFFVLSQEPGGAPVHEAAVTLFIDAIEEVEGPRVYAELGMLTAGALLGVARAVVKARPPREVEREAPRAQPTPSAPPPAVALGARLASASASGAVTSVRATTLAPRPLAAPVPDGPGPDATAWMLHLSESLEAHYPVSDPEALDDREWLALAFLRESIKPALIVGEPGVGKEFVARAVHAAMWGEARRFAVIDCALRPPSVVEDELFGDGDEAGLVAAVADGTLMLKQASALGQDRLVRLVPRLLQTSARVVFAERYRGEEPGIPKSVPSAIRVAAEDRTIHLTPLRDRPEDVSRFATYLLHRAAMQYDLPLTELDGEAEDWLASQDLALNFVELEVLVTSAALRAGGGGTLRREHFVGPDREADGAPLQQVLDLTGAENEERDQILAALREAEDNRTRAAELLGVTRGKLLRRMKKYGLD
ncbi:MAG: sigma 54-interacting transcriptional regulator [Myxococcales bacterium]|nr:sigma 54-interacting transcriptional regulator [Myxococcales bacterium]MCB9532994.1 sigma 54-interacting transcriptional regulator [Myxococcales bacterium]